MANLAAGARIAFLCPSLAAHNGIGDYLRALATECARLDCTVQLHALNEHNSSAYISERIAAGDAIIEVHRWGEEVELAERCRESRAKLDAFRPDWVSLQFEFWLFARKGFLGDFLHQLPELVRGHRAHFMAHETWTKPGLERDWREILKRPVRHYQFTQLVRGIAPQCAHTSVPPYAAQLRRLLPGIRVLPIFSNIPVDRGSPVITEPERGELTVVLFGRIPREFAPGSALAAIGALARAASRRVRLISIGQVPESDWQRLLENLPEDWQPVRLGVQDAREVSRTLQAANVALSCTPFALAGKSTSTAAFLEHGLPVLFAEERPGKKNFTMYPETVRSRLFFTDDVLPLSLLEPRPLPVDEPASVAIARQFLQDLALK